MQRRRHLATTLGSLLVVASVGGIALAASAINGEATPSPSPTGPASEQLESNTRALAQMYGSDPVRFRNDGEVGYTVSVADLGRQMTAFFARAKGEPYDPADLMAPARNDAGEIVGYKVANVGFVTRAEAMAPDFDLCALEIRARNKYIAELDRLKASGYFERNGEDPAAQTVPPEVPCTPRAR